MTLVCHSDKSGIYDDGNDWTWKENNGRVQHYPKDEYPLLPLSAVIKYEMTTDNKKIMNDLRELEKKQWNE